EELARRARAELDVNVERDLVIGRLEAEHANLRAALDWSRSSDPTRFARLTAAVAKAWMETRHLPEVTGLLEEAIDLLHDEDQELVAACRCWSGASALKLGRHETARAALEESVAWYREHGSRGEDLAVGFLALGTIALDADDLASAEALFEEARAAAELA